jgi:hypothetical protein
MGSHRSFGHLKHKLRPKERPGVKTGSLIANLTPDQKKSGIDPIYLASGNVPHIVGKLSRELQLCFRPRRDSRSARKVMRLQSHGSPGWRSFGTPTRESRGSPAGVPGVPGQKGHFDVGPVERCRVYYRGVRWWLTLEVRAVVSLVSKCSWLVPNTQGCPGM